MNIKSILERIEENGYEAYIVGGYVRDHILGITTGDIDICTNARVKELMEIFSDLNATSNEYGAIKIITDQFRIDITTYRRDLRYNGNRRNVEIEYVNNLLEDIKRRDFTMNTLCMNKNGEIIDILNARQDIENKIIRCVGNASDRLNEDPLRILRAVRFAVILDFTIEPELRKELWNNRELINLLSRERIKEEITKILVSPNALKGLNLLADLDLLPNIGIIVPKNITYVSDICGMYSQLELTKEFPFSKEEKNNIKTIKSILKYGNIDSNVLFTYGLYCSIVAGSILNIDTEEIVAMDKGLPIRTLKDIKINCNDICSILETKPGKEIKLVLDELKEEILNGRLENDPNTIKNYINANRKKWLDGRAVI